MFVKKLVEKASKKPAGNSDGLKSSDVDPALVFHYGVPSGCSKFTYDSVQKILAASTKDGRVKLFGIDSTQAILESEEMGPSKFLQFIENRGILLRVTSKNQIEVWNIEKKTLSHVYNFEDAITSLKVLQHGLFVYIGDSSGDISVLKLDHKTYHLVRMEYTIPFSASHGNVNQPSNDTAVMNIMPQPAAESKRVLIIYRDGVIVLWDIQESKSIFTAGEAPLQVLHAEKRQVTSACWACPFGSKVAIGYSSGDIFIWSLPYSNGRTELALEHGSQTGPTWKLNLGYKLDKVAISQMKWVCADERASRLYIMGDYGVASTNLIQVVLLNEHTESRTIKLAFQLPEPCMDLEIISSSIEQSKHNQQTLLVLGKSGRIFAYDDSLVEKYLIQCQAKSSTPSLPKETMIKMPYADSSITAAQFIFNDNGIWSSDYEAENIPSLFPSEKIAKDRSNTVVFSGLSKVKYLYITGHSNGCTKFWDGAFPVFPILSLEQQSEDGFSLSGVPITALCFDEKSQFLVSGDKNGMVRIFKFKPEPYNLGITKKGNSNVIDSMKVIKVDGSVLSINRNISSRHIAIGTDKGNVLLIEIEGPTVLFTENIQSAISSGIISLQFATSSLHNFEKNVLVIATKDSSVLSLDSDTGKPLSASMVHPKQHSKALFMDMLDGQTASPRSTASSESGLVLLCSEKAAYLYSLQHVVQGVKKVVYKKKFHSSVCCWASTFYAPFLGLLLFFTNGKMEIRSLPELSLLKETSIRGFTYPGKMTNTFPDSSICASRDGEILMVNGDQEIFMFSVTQGNTTYRLFESVTRVYRKNLDVSGAPESAAIIHKEKKKGLFRSVFKEAKPSKEKPAPDFERDDSPESFECLSVIFSTDNFPSEVVGGGSKGVTIDADNGQIQHEDEDDVDLNIDDIDLDDIDIDVEAKPKAQTMFAGLNKNLTSRLNTFKGKLKNVKIKNDKTSAKEEQQDEKIGSVDQIKKKYGFSSSSESTTGAANEAKNKLQDNLFKLQGISMKTTEMQDTARSFSAMAKDLLRTAEQDKRSL